MLPPRGVAAVLLYSRRPTRLAAFYRDALFVPWSRVRTPGYPPHFGCELGGVYLAILATRRPTRSTHCVAFHVDHVVATAGRLVAAGVKELSRPKRTRLGLIARFQDPDGNAFELYQP